MPETDPTLVARALAGDRDAFGNLVERYRSLVHGILLEVVRQPDEVEDLVQDTFCRAYEQLHRLQRGRRFASWLGSIAVNRGLDWWRRREVRRREASRQGVLELHAAAESPEESALRADLAEHLWRTVDRLPPEQRRVVILRYVEDCSAPEIARFLGVALATVKWRLMRARQRLGDDLRSVLHAELGAEPRDSEAERRQKIVAGLPLTVLYPRREPAGVWGWRLGWGIGVAVTAGLLGLVASRWPSPADGSDVAGGWRVWRRPDVELPAVAVAWEPVRPRQGQAIRVRAAGPVLDEPGATPELHYIWRTWYSRDHVLPMERDGEAWVTEVSLPADAVGFSFYVSPQRTGSQTPTSQLWFAWSDFCRRYDHHVDLHDDAGQPVRGALERRAQLAQRARQPEDEVVRLADAELRRYPDNVGAHTLLWRLARDPQDEPDSARLAQEMGRLLERFPYDPDVLWEVVTWAHVAGVRLDYADFARRFPRDARADYASFLAATHGRLQPQAADLQAFIRQHPHSSYADEAYATLMKGPDMALAAAVADSFLAGQLVVRRDPVREGQQPMRTWMHEGLDPLDRAYVTAFRLARERGDVGRARGVARRLIDSGLADTGPYRFVGGSLAGVETPVSPTADEARPADEGGTAAPDLALGVEVLAAGAQQVKIEDMVRWRRMSALYSDAPDWYRREQEAQVRAWAAHDRQALLLDLAAALLQAGRSDEAMAWAESGLELTSAASQGQQTWGYNAGWTAARLYLTRARALERLGRLDEAATAYAQANGAAVWMAAAMAGLQRLRGGTAAFWKWLPTLAGTPAALRLLSPDGRPQVLLWNRMGNQAADGVTWLEEWVASLGPDASVAAVYVSGGETEPPRDAASVLFLQDTFGIGEALGVQSGTYLVVLDGAGRIHVQREVYLVDGAVRLAEAETGDDLAAIGAVVRALVVRGVPVTTTAGGRRTRPPRHLERDE